MSNSSSLPDFDTFGEFLRHLRRRAGLTQRDLGQAVGYSETHITRLEKGQRLPDVTAVKGVFVEVLDLKREPESAERLVALAAKARSAPLVSVQDHAKARTNLPAQLTSFIGREHEIAEVKELLGMTRLLTLIGAGGVGKTRLAQEAAAQFVGATVLRPFDKLRAQDVVAPTITTDEFRDGVWYVELAALSDSALVPQAVATTLKLIEQPGRAPLDAVADYFEAKQALLILDNCEHLIAACADLAVHLLQRSPQLRILATSRETLRIPGEAVYRVPSLTTPPLAYKASDLSDLSEYESVRLFLERAGVAQPASDLTSNNSAEVAQVCRRLDGIPLALELAAARLTSLRLHQIANRLDDRFSLLTSGVRTALPRQQTLRATITWSVDLLTLLERELLARLSVFAGGFTAEVAEAIFEQANTLDLLANLVDKSLVIADVRGEQARYRMLETIRQYAHERLLERNEAGQIRDQHLKYFLQLAERAEPELRRADQIMWLDRLEAELDNFCAALEWALHGEHNVEAGLCLASALLMFWCIRSHWREGSDWLERALAAEARTRGAEPPSPTVTVARIQALYATGVLMGTQGYVSKRAAMFEEGLALSREIGYLDKRGKAFALWNLADAALLQDDFDRAQALFAESLVLYQEIGDNFGMAECLVQMGISSSLVGDHERARALQEEGLALRIEVGATDRIMGSYFIMGDMAHYQGDFDRATALYESCLALCDKMGDRLSVSWLLNQLAMVAHTKGEYEQAIEYCKRALTLAQAWGDKRSIAGVRHILGLIACSQGDYGQAVEHIEVALIWCREIGENGLIARALVDLGFVVLARGDYEQATKWFEEALTIARDVEPNHVIAAMGGLGRVALARGNFAKARSLLQEALTLWRERYGVQSDRIFFIETLAIVAVAQGHPRRAARLFGSAEMQYTRFQYVHSPFVRDVHERAVTAVRAQLDEATFAALWAEGQAMPPGEVVEYALDTSASPEAEHVEPTPSGL